MIVLLPITVQNWETAASLEVDDRQRDFIRSNAWSIAESRFYSELTPLGIYQGGVMIGFLMYGPAGTAGRAWLLRFMIDKRYQGRGLGTQALLGAIRRMRDEGYTEIEVAWDPDNEVAERLYLSQGFRPAGMAAWGEKTARLVL